MTIWTYRFADDWEREIYDSLDNIDWSQNQWNGWDLGVDHNRRVLGQIVEPPKEPPKKGARKR